jgi:hypothetical protein
VEVADKAEGMADDLKSVLALPVIRACPTDEIWQDRNLAKLAKDL